VLRKLHLPKGAHAKRFSQPVAWQINLRSLLGPIEG
jgi:hypothetical protein